MDWLKKLLRSRALWAFLSFGAGYAARELGAPPAVQEAAREAVRAAGDAAVEGRP